MKTEKGKKRNCIAVGENVGTPKKQEPSNKFFDKMKSFAVKQFNTLKNVHISVPHFELPKREIVHKKIRVSAKKNYRDMLRKFEKQAVRSITAVCGTMAAVFVFFMVFAIYFTPCYVFDVEGAVIGYAEDKTAYAAALNDVNSELTENFGLGAAITKDVHATLTIAKRSDITDGKEFRENVAALSDLMVDADMLVVDGQELVGFASKDELDTAVDNFIKSVSEENSTVTVMSDISSAEKYVPASKVTTLENANDILGGENGLKVQTVTNVTYDEEIPYTTQEVNDDSVFEGETQIETAGVNGVRTINAVVTAINGVEMGREILSDIVTAEPVTEVVKIGTHHIPTGVGSGEFAFPTSGTITSHFGARWNRQHKGMDIANSTGTDIRAADEGVVSYSGQMNGYGNIIIIDHKNGYKTYYGHCSELYKNVGDIVEKGTVIAAMGSTGNSTGPHLHFEIRVDDEAVDPEGYVSK